jgi:hypothetical protein
MQPFPTGTPPVVPLTPGTSAPVVPPHVALPIAPQDFSNRLVALEALVGKHLVRLDALQVIPHNFEARVTALEKIVRDQTAEVTARAKHLAATMAPTGVTTEIYNVKLPSKSPASTSRAVAFPVTKTTSTRPAAFPVKAK